MIYRLNGKPRKNSKQPVLGVKLEAILGNLARIIKERGGLWTLVRAREFICTESVSTLSHVRRL